MRREAEGYFTVEAALVMPVVLWTLMFTIYLMFFQYNRCLMEQNIGVLALRGSMLQVQGNEERMKALQEQACELYDEKYIAWDSSEIKLKLEKGHLQIEQSATLEFPFASGLLKEAKGWETNISYENRVLSPVSFLRYYQKLVGEDKDDTN